MADHNDALNSAGGGSEVHPVQVAVLKECSRSSDDAERAESSGLPVECEISEEPSDKVFENDNLREMILNKVIYSSSGTVSTADLKNIRLVRKSWLITAGDSLRQRKLPLFHLNEFQASAHFMIPATRLLNFIPSYSLRLEPRFFYYERYQTLSAFLTSYGDGLVKLDLSFPITHWLPYESLSFHLPQLQRLSVHYSYIHLPGFREDQRSMETVNPLQLILRNSVPAELKELIFKDFSLIPTDFNELQLPQSITKLSLECPLKDSDLIPLIKNELPNLTSLSLFASTTLPNSEQRIFTILYKFRTTLRSLTLAGENTAWADRNITGFRIPVMEKLEFLAVTSKCWMFSEDFLQLDERLPKMKELQILNTTEAVFEMWTENSVFPEVKKLSVSIVTIVPAVPLYNLDTMEVFTKTLTLRDMRQLHRTFPNIVELELTISEPMIAGLRYLFNDMSSLQKLGITLKGSGEAVQEQHGRHHWDALLTGLSEDKVKCFQKSRDYREAMDLDDESTTVSIRKLTALKSLTLKEAFNSMDRWTPPAIGPLISDVAFHFALLKMPCLTNLQLCGRFNVSEQMAVQWRTEKGTEIKWTDGRD